MEPWQSERSSQEPAMTPRRNRCNLPDEPFRRVLTDGYSMNVEAPILIFGGPYSNLQATQAVLTEASRRNIPRHRVVCTGDVVAYGADPKACVDLVGNAGIGVVMGNCEKQLAADADDCGCGFAP